MHAENGCETRIGALAKMSKREAASDSGPETVEDVCSFIGGICPKMYRENAMTKIRENEIDGEVGTLVSVRLAVFLLTAAGFVVCFSAGCVVCVRP